MGGRDGATRAGIIPALMTAYTSPAARGSARTTTACAEGHDMSVDKPADAARREISLADEERVRQVLVESVLDVQNRFVHHPVQQVRRGVSVLMQILEQGIVMIAYFLLAVGQGEDGAQDRVSPIPCRATSPCTIVFDRLVGQPV